MAFDFVATVEELTTDYEYNSNDSEEEQEIEDEGEPRWDTWPRNDYIQVWWYKTLQKIKIAEGVMMSPPPPCKFYMQLVMMKH